MLRGEDSDGAPSQNYVIFMELNSTQKLFN